MTALFDLLSTLVVVDPPGRDGDPLSCFLVTVGRLIDAAHPFASFHRFPFLSLFLLMTSKYLTASSVTLRIGCSSLSIIATWFLARSSASPSSFWVMCKARLARFNSLPVMV